MRSRRSKRVSSLIKEEISSLIQRDLKIPASRLVTVTDVEITDDLSYAKVFISVYGEDSKKSPALEYLKNTSGFLRRELSRRIRLRRFPELKFVWDNSIERGTKMTGLLERIKREREEKQQSRDN